MVTELLQQRRVRGALRWWHSPGRKLHVLPGIAFALSRTPGCALPLPAHFMRPPSSAPALCPFPTSSLMLPTLRDQVQTNGKKTPIQAVQGVLQDLGDEVSDIRTRFQEQLNNFTGGGGGNGGVPPPPF